MILPITVLLLSFIRKVLDQCHAELDDRVVYSINDYLPGFIGILYEEVVDYEQGGRTLHRSLHKKLNDY